MHLKNKASFADQLKRHFWIKISAKARGTCFEFHKGKSISEDMRSAAPKEEPMKITLLQLVVFK